VQQQHGHLFRKLDNCLSCSECNSFINY